MQKQKYDPDIHHRKSIRLKEYDYSMPGNYFITICTHNEEYFFGEVVDGKMVLNDAGEIARKCWFEIPKHFPNTELDVFQTMPNHIHFVLIILDNKNKCRGVIHDAHKKCDSDNVGEGVMYDAPTGDKKYFSDISSRSGSLPRIVQNFKAAVTRTCGQNNLNIKWQRNYYEHIIRLENELYQIRDYIASNPGMWNRDRNNIENVWF